MLRTLPRLALPPPPPPPPRRSPLAGAAPPRAQSRKGPSIWTLFGVSALSFAYFTYVVGKQVEEGETGRNRTSSPLTPDTSMPVDEFYKPGERYPTLSERRALKAAEAEAPTTTPPRLV